MNDRIQAYFRKVKINLKAEMGGCVVGCAVLAGLPLFHIEINFIAGAAFVDHQQFMATGF